MTAYVHYLPAGRYFVLRDDVANEANDLLLNVAVGIVLSRAVGDKLARGIVPRLAWLDQTQRSFDDKKYFVPSFRVRLCHAANGRKWKYDRCLRLTFEQGFARNSKDPQDIGSHLSAGAT